MAMTPEEQRKAEEETKRKAEEAKRQQESKQQDEQRRKEEERSRVEKQRAERAERSAGEHQKRGRGTVGGLKVSSSREERVERLEKQLEYERNKIENAVDPHELVGELGHGELGWVELDEEGMPTGPAQKEPPPLGTVAARVVGYFPTQDELVTPSGAPVTDQMNPAPDFQDAGMQARNPPPDVPLDPKGVPVVNTPVQV
jgi:hypothetical protein